MRLPIVLAAVVLSMLVYAPVGRADPPPGVAWELTFCDEFERPELDLDKWFHVCDTLLVHASSRWPENVQIKAGICRLQTRKQTRGGRLWTTAHFRTKHFTQQHGYFEVRVKVIGRPGVNSGCWIGTERPGPGWDHFQIDVLANHSPNTLQPMVFFPSGSRREHRAHWTAPANLDDRFHVYGLHWTPEEMIWYIDGREYHRLSDPITAGRVYLHLGTAVGLWAGPITDALDGTAMEVDYVRAFRRLEEVPRWPEVSQGVQ